jgi:hypothetical protein
MGYDPSLQGAQSGFSAADPQALDSANQGLDSTQLLDASQATPFGNGTSP